ncbi:putative ABC transport system permease protein [Paenibacillus sophorae]|uniref:Putative hemin transport system permease protein HrtB n=1 Tax=Paenibacillus sophorae TaxID=1333845 RepID=A0A1H8HYY8_9BACL|nr:FtsX-like permease family protein [Paenibacillus sophorae]QWU15792.1 ABC transporter permease [Paenibacillus sophorae]SEN61106.1 putative ABC transport system permease protein [Paenibacillus sophorae]
MNLFSLSLRNIRHRLFLSFLTVCAIGATVAFIVLFSLFRDSVEQGAEKGYGPFDLVIGAQGSETQLVLNTFYHIGAPTGNIPANVLEEARRDSGVDKAYAMTTGDNYNGFPVVGIDPEYFLTRYGDRTLKEGALYTKMGEAVVGSHVAQTLGLHVGDTFTGAHGLVEEEGQHSGEEETGGHAGEGETEEHSHEGFLYTVTGILPTLNTPDDRAVFTTVDYAWAVHELQGEDREITAVLVKPSTLLGAHNLKQTLDGNGGVQAAYTSKAVSDVVNAVDQGSRLVEILAGLCVLLAAITILLSLIAAAGERTKDAGLLRLLGKPKSYVWMTLISEGLILTLTGLAAGFLAGHLAALLFKEVLFAKAGVRIDPYLWNAEHGWIAAGTIAIGLLASLIPAFRMYRLHPLALFKS